MPEIIQQKKYELSARTAKIIALAESTDLEVQEIKRRERRTVEQGLELGALLNEEQDWVNEKLGKGSWNSYFDITFSKVISFSMAGKWQKQAKDNTPHSVTTRSPIAVNEPLAKPEQPQLTDTQLRKGLLTLGVIPPKRHEPTALAGPTTATPQLSPHLSLINRLMAWHTELLMQSNGEIPQQQRIQFKQDFAPILTLVAGF